MPLIRYFVVMGGILLSLLLLADRYLPKPEPAAATADVDRSTIRLRSSQRWPEAIRIDTNAVVPPLPVVAASDLPGNAPVAASALEAYAAEPLPQLRTSGKHELSESPARHAKRVGRSIVHN